MTIATSFAKTKLLQGQLSNYREQITSTSSRTDLGISSEKSSNPNEGVEIFFDEWSVSQSELFGHLALAMLSQAQNSVSTLIRKVPELQGVAASRVTLSKTQRQAAITLIDQWLADDSEYDNEAWQILKKNIEDNRLSYRKRFNE